MLKYIKLKSNVYLLVVDSGNFLCCANATVTATVQCLTNVFDHYEMHGRQLLHIKSNVIVGFYCDSEVARNYKEKTNYKTKLIEYKSQIL